MLSLLIREPPISAKRALRDYIRFSRFHPSERNVAKVLQLVEEMDKADTGRSCFTETTLARPSEQREKLKMLDGKNWNTQRLNRLYGKQGRFITRWLGR